MFFNTREEVIKMTPQWKGERLEDGRPMVPASVLERMRRLTLEEVWGLSYSLGYEFQSEAHFMTTHSTEDHRLVGRAVTCVCVPLRQDLHEVATAESRAFGFKGGYNKSAVDRLVEDDVMVVDLFDKVYYGTFFGGNLSTQVKNKTKRGGAVIWGGIRDMEQIVKIDGIQVYYRGIDPTGIGDVTMTGFNVPTRIGKATCLPGDIVLGTISGVIFIPAHLAEEVVVGAEKSHVRDIFGFQRLDEKKYTTAQIDARWTYDMWEDFVNWFNTDEKAVEYRHLTWEEELKEAAEYQKTANAADVRL
jgi:regulator of RNase E activity RraA